MHISHMTYTRVSAGREIPDLQLQAHNDVEIFLSAHVITLLELAEENRVPPGEVTSNDARTGLERLRGEETDQFLETARKMCTTLTSEMDGRSKDGLLVLLRCVHR